MITPASGALLIAEPFLKDPNFSRSVIFLCEHLTQGSFGLVINKPLKITLNQVIDSITDCTATIYYGGPVQLDTIHFLHQLPHLIPGSTKVADGIYWGGEFETVVQLINNKKIDLTRIQFYLGYSGWEEGQLQQEVYECKSWLAVAASDAFIFHKNQHKSVWADALTHLGGEYEQLKNYPIDPQLN